MTSHKNGGIMAKKGRERLAAWRARQKAVGKKEVIIWISQKTHNQLIQLQKRYQVNNLSELIEYIVSITSDVTSNMPKIDRIIMSDITNDKPKAVRKEI